MNRLVVRLAILSATIIIPQAAVSQSATGTNSDEIKSIIVPMPRGLVRAEARDIDKEWSPSIVHLKGNARVRIYTATKDPRGAIVMQADEVDLNQTTGEISPRGNVRLTVEGIK
jgi:lipopolysaccharide assembly outer membrane protein LptD (OstA)